MPYVPPYWVRQAVLDPHHTLVGREACFRAAVLFVDISSFTPITETLSQRGPEGMEELSELLDRYFGAMSEPVQALGGQVFKFAGDSLIVLLDSDEQDLYLGAAVECAMRMQQAAREFGKVRTPAGLFPLQIKVGISEGPVYTTTVGDEAGGMQPVLAGRALVRAMQAEQVAEAGEVLVDAMLTSRLPGQLDIREARGTFRLISGASGLPLGCARAFKLADLKGRHEELLVQRLKPYLAAQVLERIEQGDRAVLCEHRTVTTMFVRFGGLQLDRMVLGCAESGGRVSLSRDGEILQDYVVAMRDCIRRHGGRLNEVDFTDQGGTLVAFFGAPTAQENDELLAAACACEMQRVLAHLQSEWGAQPGRSDVPNLCQCVSISSGTVFVGDVGADARRTYAVVGDGVNLASRLSGLAQWGEMLVTEPVRRAVEEQFTFVPLGEREIRGKIERVSVSLLVGPLRQEYDDSALSNLLLHCSPIGRASELALLDDVRKRAWGGVPQLLQMIGPAGIGKSCLAGELVNRWLVRGGRVFSGEDRFAGHRGCQEMWTGQASSYALWSALIRDALGVRKADSRAQQQQSVRQGLTALALPVEYASILESSALADVSGRLSLAVDTRRLYRAVVALFQSASMRRPLLVVLEDVDRADDASLDLLKDVLCDSRIAQKNGSALLICLTGRPTGQPDLWTWINADEPLPSVVPARAISFEITRMILDPLSETDSHSLALQLLQDAKLESDLLPILLRRGGGNPFFIHELVREWADARDSERVSPGGNVEHAAEQAFPVSISAEDSIPGRVAHAILAQLDPLGEELKQTLRLAAVIGQTFSFHVLQVAHVDQPSAAVLARRLATLERMHIVRLTHFGGSNSKPGGDSCDAESDLPNVYYRFRHSMTQRVLYASLVRADLKRFHQAVGYAIECVYSPDLDTQYERLAEHFRRGKVLVRAVVYSILAGRAAVKTRAVREALIYYDWADEMLSEHLKSGQANLSAWPVRGIESPGAHVGARSAYLCAQGVQLSLMLERSRVLLYLMQVSKAKADLERAVSLAIELADLGLQGKSLLALAEILYHQAEYGEAVAVVRRALQCFAALGDRRRQARVWKLQSRIHAELGQAEAALWCAERAGGTAYGRYLESVYVRLPASCAKTQGDVHAPRPSTTDWSLTIERPMWLALVSLYCGEWGHALRLARDGIAAGWALGTPLDVADAKWVLACVLTRVGASEEASVYLDEAMAAYQEAGWKRGQISGLVLGGQGRMDLGEPQAAAEFFEQALAYAKETHSVGGIVDAQVGLGRLAAASRQWCRAERWCVEARARARRARLGPTWIEAQIGLAQVYLAQQRWEPARLQAAQASASSNRFGFRDLAVGSAEALGQAWLGLKEVDQARSCFEEADAVAKQLARTLPPAYERLFWERWGTRLERI